MHGSVVRQGKAAQRAIGMGVVGTLAPSLALALALVLALAFGAPAGAAPLPAPERGETFLVHRAHVSARTLIYAQVRAEVRAARRAERRAHRQSLRAVCRDEMIARGLRGPARREAVQACTRARG